MSHKILEPRACSVEGCETLSKYLTKGMCQKHYARVYRKGTIETERSMHGVPSPVILLPVIEAKRKEIKESKQ